MQDLPEGFIAWMSRPGPPEAVDGVPVMRTIDGHMSRWMFLERLKRLGDPVEFSTQGGKRRHIAVIAAILEPSDPMNNGQGRFHWLSDEEQARFESTPKRKRYMLGGITIVRIVESEHAGMVGYYFCR